jgi:hypothetical protein
MPASWTSLFGPAHDGSLRAYAEFFDTALLHVRTDSFPDAATLARLRQETHEDFAWTVALEDERMLYRFPHGHPEREKRGALNPRFLDPHGVGATVAALLRHLDPHLRVVMLCIGPVYRTETLTAGQFHDTLIRCLDALPPECRYAVETTNTGLVLPACRTALRERNVAFVPAGLPLPDALTIPDVLSADVCVLRSDRFTDCDEELGIREAVRRCLDARTTLYAYCRATAENGPEDLVRLLAGLDGELARRSPIRRKAA